MNNSISAATITAMQFPMFDEAEIDLTPTYEHVAFYSAANINYNTVWFRDLTHAIVSKKVDLSINGRAVFRWDIYFKERTNPTFVWHFQTKLNGDDSARLVTALEKYKEKYNFTLSVTLTPPPPSNK